MVGGGTYFWYIHTIEVMWLVHVMGDWRGEQKLRAGRKWKSVVTPLSPLNMAEKKWREYKIAATIIVGQPSFSLISWKKNGRNGGSKNMAGQMCD